jgi:hypothetical protein
MKNLVLKALSILAVVGASHFAQAQDLNCGIQYDIKGGGFKVGVGYFKMKGAAKIVCENVHGEKFERTAVMIVGGWIPSAIAAAGYLHVRGGVASFGFNGSIDDLYAHYVTLDAHASAGLGVGTSFTVQSPRHKSLRLAFDVQASTGFGFNVGISGLSLEPSDKAYEDMKEDMKDMHLRGHEL